MLSVYNDHFIPQYEFLYENKGDNIYYLSTINNESTDFSEFREDLSARYSTGIRNDKGVYNSKHLYLKMY